MSYEALNYLCWLFWEVLGMLAVICWGFARETFSKSWTIILYIKYCTCLFIQKNSVEDLRFLESVTDFHNLKVCGVFMIVNLQRIWMHMINSYYSWRCFIFFQIRKKHIPTFSLWYWAVLLRTEKNLENFSVADLNFMILGWFLNLGFLINKPKMRLLFFSC